MKLVGEVVYDIKEFFRKYGRNGWEKKCKEFWEGYGGEWTIEEGGCHEKGKKLLGWCVCVHCFHTYFFFVFLRVYFDWRGFGGGK